MVDLLFLILLFDKYLAVNIIKLILANSLGWIPNEPIPNQLREPFLMVPIPGINTKISSIKLIINNLLLYLLYIW